MEVWTLMRKVQKAKMKVSVIIPVKDYKDCLEECISSIQSQTNNDDEIILVDGTSTDLVKKIIVKKQEEGKKLRYLKEKFFSNGSLINSGIMNTEGEVVLLTKGDCRVPKDWISSMIEPIETGKSIVQGGVEHSGKKFWSRVMDRSNKRKIASSSKWKNFDHLDVTNIAIKRDAIIDAGLIDRHVKKLEDLDLKIRLKRYDHRVCSLDDVKVMICEDEKLKDIIHDNFENGKWTYFIYCLHKKDTSILDEIGFKELRIRQFLFHIPYLILVLISRGPSQFIYESLVVTSIRVGIIAGIFKKKRFLSSIQAKYD
jgi:glycosyltransferase involved in cell wall biosynthesis